MISKKTFFTIILFLFFRVQKEKLLVKPLKKLQLQPTIFPITTPATHETI